jgi:DNA-binding FadR family transcriptional regulator
VPGAYHRPMAGPSTAPSRRSAAAVPDPPWTPVVPGVGEAATRLGAPVLRGIRRLTALDTVRARIAMAIDLGLLAPGERLPPNPDIAAALGVGEMTVRRALVALCENGLLVRRRGRNGGTHVATDPPGVVVAEAAAYLADAERVHGLIDQRLALECGLVQLACTAATPQRLATLEGLVARMNAAGNWAQFHSADDQFHRELAAAACRPAAAALLRGVLTDLYAYFLPYPVECLRSSNDEHRRLVGALRAGDRAEAVALCCQHVDILHCTMFVGLTVRSDSVAVSHGLSLD